MGNRFTKKPRYPRDSVLVAIRVTGAERKELAAKAKAAGVSVSELMRRAVFGRSGSSDKVTGR